MSDTDVRTAAKTLGTEHGHSAATWVFDGNTPQATYDHLRDALDNSGWPLEEIDMPGPLSGEWADSLTPAGLMAQLQADDADYEEVCDAYEVAFSEAWTAEVERVVRYHTTEDARP